MRAAGTLKFLFLVMSVCFASMQMRAQPVTGTLTGEVISEGSPLPGVSVSLTSTSLQAERETVTDEHGHYSFVNLPPGDYRVAFAMEGLRTELKSVRVGLAQRVRMDAGMSDVEVASAMIVTASAPAIVETQEVQTSYDSELIDRLPLGRSLQATALLAPGVNDTGPGWGALVISGAPSFDSLYLVDGAVVNENIRGQAHNLFIEDAIAETTIITGAISAEYGRFTGGVVNTITKSGGNEFSASLRDSVSNPSWTADRYRDADRLNKVNQILEATVGGRVLSDRLWFFTAGRFFENERDAFLAASQIPFRVATDERRFELKLTGQMTMRHSAVGSYLDVGRKQQNNCQFGCLEISTVDPQTEALTSATAVRYNGILTSSLIVEALFSDKKFALRDYGGESRDPAEGSWGFDSGSNAYFGAPVFCAICGDQNRDSSTYTAKASHYLATPRSGTHSLVAGYEKWTERTLANNFQSASNFAVMAQTPVARDAQGVVRPIFTSGLTEITYYPILEESQGTNFSMYSVFLNDRWEPNNHLSFNLGVRYDRNDGRNSVGKLVADDAQWSPRLAATFDLQGNGRRRLNASFSRYVTKIPGAIGETGSPGGNPAEMVWIYNGPTINEDQALDSRAAMRQLFDWFFSQGGTDQTPAAGSIPGLTSQINGTLKSPSVDEWSLGYGALFGRSGFARVDLIRRDWADFYSSRIDKSTGRVTDAFGNAFDRALVGNTNDLQRNYSALQLQGGHRLYGRVNLGGNYTWSRLKGNAMAETLTSGPIPDQSGSYPEYKAFARNNPVGLLPSDRTHKVRLWTELTVPSRAGNFSISLLERYDSGTPYELVGAVDPGVVTASGYANPPRQVNYFFTDRGEYRWEATTSTDLAINYSLPMLFGEFFVHGEVFNVFDQSAQIGGNTRVITALSGQNSLKQFDPFRETPVEGVHYLRSRDFGKPRGADDYQLPRTFQFSLGMRF